MIEQGIVLYWNFQRGFGFLATENESYYCHASNFHGIPVIGGPVRFTLAPGKPGKGPQAVNASPVKLGGGQ